jgi:hypothetical protein
MYSAIASAPLMIRSSPFSDTFLIDVQLQTDALTGWIRISATVPCEADRIVSAFASILGTATASVEHAFRAELKLQSLSPAINAERCDDGAPLLTSNQAPSPITKFETHDILA